MARLRPTRAVRALTFEEKTRVANFFMLLIEIDTQKGVTRRRRSPRTAAAGCKTKSASSSKSCESPQQKARYKNDPTELRKQSRVLFLRRFGRILYCNINFSSGGATMIDTVILTLVEGTFEIINPDAFTPSAKWALPEHAYNLRGMISMQNPTKLELAMRIYKPRLTLSNRYKALTGYKTLLKIELSLPKLFFGNNFEELTQKDFPALAQKLCTALHTMGIATDVAALAKASVSVIHYSKNILLTDGSTPYHYISKIKDANISLALDVNQTDYRNEGHCYKWHSGSYELVFYDKIRDLEKAKISDKRSMEKDPLFAYGYVGQVAQQLHLYDALHNKKNFEVLRMEVRLNKRRKIQQMLKKLNIKAQLTLKGLFKTSIARKVLLHYLDEIERARPQLLDFKANNAKALLVGLIFSNPNASPRRIMQLYGIKLALEHISVREFRTMLGPHNKRSWYRLMTDVNEVQLKQAPKPFAVIRDCLIKFKAISAMLQ